MTRTLKTLAATAALATSLAVGACSSNTTMSGHPMPGDSMTAMGTATTSPSAADSAAHNEADVTFASSMVPHHQQAIEMADLALTHATNADVKELATQIKAAQDPEIATMTGWLTSWGAAPMPSGDHDMGGMSMDGMMSADEMSALAQASGPTFDRMWLQLMIKHHEGAVSMARTQLSQGQSPDVKALAQDVVDGQTKEITTMTDLLKTSL